jgi:hypothetical protein
MKKKVELKKLKLNKEKVISLSADQSELIKGGTIILQPKPKPSPNPNPNPVPQEPPITAQSRVEDCTIVGH